MCPDKKISKDLRLQRGFLLPLALFIIIGMGVLALAISRTSEQTNSSSIQEFSNIQAFYAAESGAQRGMKVLFFRPIERKTIDGECATMAINHNFSGVDGLKACVVQVNCTCRYRNDNVCNTGVATNYDKNVASPGVAKSFYTITSVGSCGQRHFRAVRTVQVGAFLDQE